jgi:hypothetical protein
VPESDYDALAARLVAFDRLVVESHPALIGDRLTAFRTALRRAADGGRVPELEVAVGLETANPAALEQLHKRFTVEQFAAAAERLRVAGVALRVFLLAGVPFIPRARQSEWIGRSIAYAFDCGASAVTLIPSRGGNGAMEALADAGVFEPPTLVDLEDALDRALPRSDGRVFVDLWDLQRFSSCPACYGQRRDRLRVMNLEQRVLPRVACTRCAAQALPAC